MQDAIEPPTLQEYHPLKQDLILLQFKLVSGSETRNTISFLNLPSNNMDDINVQTLKQILTKTKINFLPYNKSILTRILYLQLQRKNVLAISHFSFEGKNNLGLSKGILNELPSFGFADRVSSTKISSHQAAKLLEKHFFFLIEYQFHLDIFV